MASCPVDDEDMVFHILHGLPSAYDSFKTSIRARPETITVEELISLLSSESIHSESQFKNAESKNDLSVF